MRARTPPPLRGVYLRRLVGAVFVVAASRLPAQPSVVVIVRHAERAAAPADDPGLTTEGVQRGRDLAAALASTRVGLVITTQLKRTQLTAGPLVEKTNVKTIVVPTGERRTHAEAVAAAVRAAPAGEAVLVVGHSNTVPAIIAALGGPAMPDLCDGQYSNLFVLVFSGTDAPRFIQSTYGAPDPPNAASCTEGMKKPPH